MKDDGATDHYIKLVKPYEKGKRTSTVVIFMPAGFHRGRFQPSTHMAPKLRRLTVPSPSPTLIPFRIYHANVRYIL